MSYVAALEQTYSKFIGLENPYEGSHFHYSSEYVKSIDANSRIQLLDDYGMSHQPFQEVEWSESHPSVLNMNASSVLVGMRNNPVREAKVSEQEYIEKISSILKSFKTRPFTLLVSGAHQGHTASYVVRVDEANHCELLALNTLPEHDEQDEHYIQLLQKGLKLGLNLPDDYVIQPIRRVLQQQDFSCEFLTANILAKVNVNHSLQDQTNDLVAIANHLISHSEFMRKLYARIIWWNREVYRSMQFEGRIRIKDKFNFTDDEVTQMKRLFEQLSYLACGLECPTKMDMPQDAKMRDEYKRFLNVLNIKVNDNNFLKLFNPHVKSNAEIKAELISDLNAYITRIDSNPISHNLRYSIFISHQIKNRRANCNLAKQLLASLENASSINDIHGLFSASNIKTLRVRQTCLNKINSNELNGIITRARGV